MLREPELRHLAPWVKVTSTCTCLLDPLTLLHNIPPRGCCLGRVMEQPLEGVAEVPIQGDTCKQGPLSFWTQYSPWTNSRYMVLGSHKIQCSKIHGSGDQEVEAGLPLKTGQLWSHSYSSALHRRKAELSLQLRLHLGWTSPALSCSPHFPYRFLLGIPSLSHFHRNPQWLCF